MNKRIKEIDQELDALFACMEVLPKDSEAYRNVLNRYGTLLQMREDYKISKKTYDVIKDVLGIGLRISGTVVMPAWLALLAYSNDESLKMVNQRIWNTAVKFVLRKE